MKQTHRNRPSRQGFTLVELLVVIVIIGMLAGLTTGAVWMALVAANKAAIGVEIAGMETALENYKTTYGEYPPDFAGINDPDKDVREAAQKRVVRHLRVAFPKLRLNDKGKGVLGQFDSFLDLLAPNPMTGKPQYGLDKNKYEKYLNPSTAMAFWLGGLPEQVQWDSSGNIVDGSWVPQGFHTDPANPFKEGIPRTTPFFNFDQKRLVRTNDPFTGAGWPSYHPNKAAYPTPYVYFRPVLNTSNGKPEYGTVASSVFKPLYHHDELGVQSGVGTAVPYLKTFAGIWDKDTLSSDTGKDTSRILTRNWFKPDSYQIISCGLDGRYGHFEGPDPSASDYPREPVYDLANEKYSFREVTENQVCDPNESQDYIFGTGDYDNITNFSDGTLEDTKP